MLTIRKNLCLPAFGFPIRGRKNPRTDFIPFHSASQTLLKASDRLSHRLCLSTPFSRSIQCIEITDSDPAVKTFSFLVQPSFSFQRAMRQYSKQEEAQGFFPKLLNSFLSCQGSKELCPSKAARAPYGA